MELKNVKLHSQGDCYEHKKTKQGGLGIVSILTIVFIVLKLSGVIKWHWIWVLSPIWISALTAVVLFAGILIGGRLKRASGNMLSGISNSL